MSGTTSDRACGCDPDNAEDVAERMASKFYERTGIPVSWKDYFDAEKAG